MVPYREFHSHLHILYFIEIVSSGYKDKYIEDWKKKNASKRDDGSVDVSPLDDYIFFMDDMHAGASPELVKYCADVYVKRMQGAISERQGSFSKNAHLIDHMGEICATLIKNLDMDLEELARTFKPEKTVFKKEKEPLDAVPLVSGDLKSEIQGYKSDLTSKPTEALLSSFGIDIGHQLRLSNKAVTNWQKQNRFGLPVSFQLFKRLSAMMVDVLSEEQNAQQRMAALDKASKLIDKIIDQLPMDQKTINQDLKDSENAREILRTNAIIAGELCDSFNDVAPSLKQHTHKVGSEDKKTFNDSFIDTKAQEMRLLRHTYASKELGYEAIDMPALMSMSMNLNSMGITLDLIIDNIETAMREISADNMQAANKAIRKMNDRVSKINEIVEEAEQTIGMIADGESKPLHITHQPLGENGDADISVIRISNKPS